MKITINYKFKSMNDLIRENRTSYHNGNTIKQKETMLSALAFSKIPKIEKFPIELTFKWHIKTKTSDLDGRTPKSIIDGLVKAKKIPDDNVKYIQRIIHEYVSDTKDYVEVEIKEMK